MKKTVRVVLEREYEIEIMPSMFCGMSEEEFVAEWCNGLWYIEGMDDVVKHAAEMAVKFGNGNFDGLGLLSDSDYPRKPDVKYKETFEDVEVEIIS